jgi:3-hydroxymyristoyl/3-hydroxydecanoyl-(acyl carrier protein) dehydratase
MIQPEKLFSHLAPTLSAADSAQGSATWTVPGDLPYFNGHFPGAPILPAIAIIDASLVLLQKHTPTLNLSSVDAAKFLCPITPGQSVRIEWTAAGEHLWDVEWKKAFDGEVLAELRLRTTFSS